MKNLDLNGKVVFEFYSDGCFNCLLMQPIIDELESEFPQIRFYRLNADTNKDLIEKYHIDSLPTILMFRNAHLINTLTGVKSKAVIERIIWEKLIFAQ